MNLFRNCLSRSVLLRLSSLEQVKPWKTSWLIQVKVIHTWKPSNVGYGETLEIIFADKKGFKIQATCKKNYLMSLGDQCRVGEWKTVENFTLTPARSHFRTTQHAYKMSFINQTVIKPYEYLDDDMFLSLADYDSVLGGRLDNDFLIDILGQAIDVSDIQTLQCSGKEKKKIEFTLRDINDQRIACCLWGKFAEVMESHREEAQFGVVCCLIRFAKIGSFRSKLQISNAYDSSLLLVNPKIKEAQDLEEMFKINENSLTVLPTSQEGQQIVTEEGNEVQHSLDTWKQYEDKTISEMLCSTQIEKCKVVSTVYAIDTDYAWYYFGCEACNHRTFKVLEHHLNPNNKLNVKPLWWCEKCNKNVINVSPRFKLHLIVKDDTAETKMILLDWVAAPVLGVKAEKILNGSLNELEDPELLPQCIKDIVGKTFKFGVTIEKDNISKGADLYKVLKVWSVNNTLMADSQSETERGTRQISGSEGSLITYSDESSSKMTTPSKRAHEDMINIPDTTSTSKKRPHKKGLMLFFPLTVYLIVSNMVLHHILHIFMIPDLAHFRRLHINLP